MALKEVKITFLKDHSPRKKGEVMVAKTHDEIRVAEWYLANQIAERCECKDGGSGCAACDEAKEKKETAEKPTSKAKKAE